MATSPEAIPVSSWDHPQSQSGRATPQDFTPPSYAGSFGSNQDSSGWPDDSASYVLAANDDYNPTDFDAHDASPFDNHHLNFFEPGSLQPDVLADLDLQPGTEPSFPIHLSLTPADPNQKQQQHYFADLSSPGSSPGSVHNDRASHSRASSVSSIHSVHHSPMPGHHSLSPDAVGPPQFSTTGPSPPTSPQVKAQSPPALVIPTDSPNVRASLYAVDQKPSHLLPGQPSIDINIVPSTPISGGVAHTVPFQHVLHNLNQQNALNQPQSQGGASAGGAQDSQDRQQQQQFANQSQSSPRPHHSPLLGRPNAMEVESSSMWSLPHPQPHSSPSMSPYRNGTPSLQHFRHHSDDSVRLSQSLQNSPAMAPASFPRGSDLSTGLVNLNLGLQQQFAGNNMSQQLNNGMLFAAQPRGRTRSDPSLDPPNWGPNAQNNGAGMLPAFNGMGGLGLNGMGGMGGGYPGTVDPNDVLSRDPGVFSVGALQAPYRMQSFEDDGMLLDVSLRRSRSDAAQGHRRNVRSEDFGRMYVSMDGSQDGLLRSITTPDGSLAPSDPRILSSPSMRRRNSSRGHERGSSLSSSARPSPYPSPSASPRPPNEMLPGAGPLDVTVSRPHVTTPATATASSSRRKSEANFICPVPGCGSTFTRHFNLKGHLRSHNEERPFKCKWPGCEKGFARQHDCKRHEALHLNIRPYTCDGCGKTFARMDALNRHLRSEGGVECRRTNDDGEPVGGFDMPLGADGGGDNGDNDEWTPQSRGLVL